MDVRRWADLKAAFAAIADLGPEEQARRLARLASTDPELAGRLESLLTADKDAESRLSELTPVTSPELAPDSGGAAPADPSQPPDPLGLAGRSVSHFRVQDVLGSGGMGVVYRAEDLHLGRTVALKFLLPQYTIEASAKERFFREARAVSALDHPNVCTVHEVGEGEQGQPFLAMACYAGQTLKDRLAKTGPLPIPEALDIAEQVVAGLDAAHTAGIVHRDLKPGNLMLTPDGTVKILDFGLAKTRDPNLTDPDRRPGTVAYMSPEQLVGDTVDHRTDLWSLGVVLHEMLTGRMPFGSGHELSTVYSILNDRPPTVSDLRDGIPARLDRTIETLLRKEPSERFVSAADVLAALELAAGEPAGPAALRRPRRRPLRRWVLPAIVVAGVVGVVVAAVSGRDRSELSEEDRRSPTEAGAPAAAEQASIAVLPFLDLSPEGDQEYFTDGMAEELIGHLSKLGGLKVSARSSSFRFRDRSTDVREVGSRLGVDHVLDGSVRRSGNRLRVSVQLVDTEDGSSLWTETYEGGLGDIFAVQDEISSAIVEALRVRLSPSATTASLRTATLNVEAYELFLRGRFFANRRTEDALSRAAEYFERAIAVDPMFARAYAGLAETHVAPRRAAPSQRFLLGREASLEALALDSTLAEAHTTLGWIRMWYDRDWPGAERHFHRALASDPNYLWAHQWYSAYLAAVGRVDEGLAAIEAARRIDPVSVTTITHVGSLLFWLGRYDEAIAQYRQALELDPGFYMAHWGLARTFLQLGRPGEALAELQYEGTDYIGFYGPALLGHAYAVTGREQEARGILAELHDRARTGDYVAPTEFAAIHIGLEELETALDWLERHESDRGARIFLRADPMFDPVRSHPRFLGLMTRLGLGSQSDGG